MNRQRKSGDRKNSGTTRKRDFTSTNKNFNKEPSSDLLRLNKYIASSGVCSRRDADELIQAGEVMVNGKVVKELGVKVSRNDDVQVKGKRVNPEKKVYLLLNKPKDFITTMEDPENRKTVMELVKNAGKERIFPVGRLDRNTTGLLLFTNDGALAKKLTHPSHRVKKIYEVHLDKPIQDGHLEQIKKGFDLEDGPVKADDVQVVSPDKTILGIEIHEGRNRIVRRIFENFGYDVVKLDRMMYAGLTKRDLPRGKWRFLSEKELINLKYLAQ